jgi:hypothetical protein
MNQNINIMFRSNQLLLVSHLLNFNNIMKLLDIILLNKIAINLIDEIESN